MPAPSWEQPAAGSAEPPPDIEATCGRRDFVNDHGRLAPRGPLPPPRFLLREFCGSALSRGVAQRVGRRLREQLDVDRAVRSLNSFHHFDGPAVGCGDDGGALVPSAQRAALSRIAQAVHDLGPPPLGLSPRGSSPDASRGELVRTLFCQARPLLSRRRLVAGERLRSSIACLAVGR